MRIEEKINKEINNYQTKFGKEPPFMVMHPNTVLKLNAIINEICSYTVYTFNDRENFYNGIKILRSKDVKKGEVII